MGRKVRVFYSYAQEDAALREELDKHLATLRHDGLIEGWHDRLIPAGADRKGEIDRRLEEADLILLLVSADFLASDYCYGVETKRALERCDAGAAVVVPILLRPVVLGSVPFARLEALPPGGTPVVKFPDREDGWVAVASSLRQLAEELSRLPTPPAAEGAPGAGPAVPSRLLLKERLVKKLERERCLLLLAPRGGGAEALAEDVARASAFAAAGPGGERVTWLRPFSVSACGEADYFRLLTGVDRVTGAAEYVHWQAQRAGEAPHLIVLVHDGGPAEHLRSLAAGLRLLKERHKVTILVAGGARAAALRFEGGDLSVLSGIPAEHVPDLAVAEVAELLRQGGRPAELATGLHRATGGHPGLLAALLGADEALHLDEGAATKWLRKSEPVRGALRRRLQADDREAGLRSHGRDVLRDLLAGKEVARLDDVEDDLRHGEVRLYYDGLVRAAADGRTELRCEAVRQAAEAELR